LNIFDTGGASGGTLLHTQTEDLVVSNGVFHTTLNAPDAVWSGDDRWVELSVNYGPVLNPRVKIGWVPYAIHSPRLPNQLIERPTGRTRSVASGAWEKLDSLTITSANGGIAMITHVGATYFTGTLAGATMYPILLAIGPEAPYILFDTQALPNYAGALSPMNFTVFRNLTPGTNKLYLWAQVFVKDQEYQVQTQRLQAIFLPNQE
jgi:hypothetical protein